MPHHKTDNFVYVDALRKPTWMERLGTHMFDREMMLERIFIGSLSMNEKTGEMWRDLTDPTALCLAEWIIFVPEVFREGVMAAVAQLADSILFQKATRTSINEFISLFHQKLDQAYKDQTLTRDGWAT